MEQVLSGVTVLEWCSMVAGPYCTKLMADLGAYVIKVEDPEGGDEARRRGPFLHDVPHPERSGLFLYLNTNKKGITLNLGCARGRELFLELAKKAQVLVEDKPPMVLKEMGLDYECLQQVNPSLVVTSITPFGQTGPYRDYKAYPFHTLFSGGEGFMTPYIRPHEREAFKGRPPVQMGNYVGEYICGISAAGATMVALFWQERTGEGQHVDISKQETVVHMARTELQQYISHGALSNRYTGTQLWAGRHPCKDGYVYFAPFMARHWTLVPEYFAALGMTDWLGDEEKKTRAFYDEREPELRPVLEEVFKNYTKDELFALARKIGIPFGPFYTVDEVFNSGQEAARDFFQEVEHKEAGRFKYPSAPYRFSETPWQGSAAPLLGEHNEEVFGTLLGLSKEELVKLRQVNVL